LLFNTYRDYLVYYAELGVRVVPVRYMAKEPVIPWREGRIPIGVIDSFMRKGYNIAVICGTPSAGLVILDFEDIDKVKEVFSKWEELFKKTVVVKTARGCHIWLRCDRMPESMYFPDYQLEVRSEGMLAICPPSRHPSGIFYEFINAPDDIMLIGTLAPMIAKLKGEVDYEYRAPVSPHGRLRWRFTGKEPCLVYIKSGVRKGYRNMAALILASYYYRHVGLSDDDVLEKLLTWNELNKPPLDKREIKNVVKSEVKHGYAFSCKGIIRWGFCKPYCPLARDYHTS